MDCETTLDSLGAWIDQQLEAHQATALESHLSICAECRAEADARRVQDANLLRAFQPHREAAHEVANRAIAAWNAERSHAVSPSPPANVKWLSLLAATAAGFLFAVLLFQPWKKVEPIVQDKPTVPERISVTPTVASLVVATGNVETRDKDSESWITVSDIPAFHCPSGGAVKTGPNVRCELKTSDGCIIRLNDETEVAIPSGNTVEVKRGQIWCSSPDNVSLKVVASSTAERENGVVPTSPWAVACPADSSMLTDLRGNGEVQITTAEGEVEVQAAGSSERLQRGESASIVDGKIVKSGRVGDPILDARWTHSLLIRKGHGDPELTARVDELLARMGYSKVTLLYEQEIRSLGEYAVLPLMRFVQSPISQNDPRRRETAMRILSDIAPNWTISELIDLLSDPDATTRVYAAAALQRLTGLNQGRAPEQWNADLDQCSESIERWQRWWSENQQQFPPRLKMPPEPPSAPTSKT